MDDILNRTIHDTILNAPEHGRIVDAVGSVTDADRLIQTFVPALTRTLLKNTHECKHVLSLHDEDFLQKRLAALAGGSAWKSRGRDRKGQLFRLVFREGLLQGWSSETHTWVIVVPHSLQIVVYDWLKNFYAQCNDQTKEAFAKYESSLTRDYAATVGERATNRGLFEIQHRQCLDGRRNKFIKVPKPLY